MEPINMEQHCELMDMLEEFRTDFLNKVLEKRDQMWHKRQGNFKYEQEEKVYEDMRMKGVILERLYNAMKAMCVDLAISDNVMKEYLSVIDKMQIAPEGKFRESLFSEQRIEMERVTEKIKKIFISNTETYERMTK